MQSDGKPFRYRIVVDLKELNSQIAYTTVPNPEDLLDTVCQRYSDPSQTSQYFTSIDM